MKIKQVHVAMLVGTLFASCYRSPIERNTIVFEDKYQNVQDSLSAIRLLLPLIPKANNPFNTNYYYQGDNLFINNTVVGDTDSLVLDTVKALGNFSSEQRVRFISISRYLMDNHISAGYTGDGKIWFFEYRPIADGDFHDTREIHLLEGTDTSLLVSKYKVLDRRGKVLLLAPAEADTR